ncbi:MAG TPA: hypothetical protein VFI54_19520 [Solirubrobacteraceae bacterium]|nr:hypothetical protein [Solirubrobacteraceae bacterium]
MAASFALPATALANRPPNLTCEITATTLFYSGTYNNMTVPPGQTCELSGATVLGNVAVETAANVTFESPGTVGETCWWANWRALRRAQDGSSRAAPYPTRRRR